MRLLATALAAWNLSLAGSASASWLPAAQHIFANPPPLSSSAAAYRIPTVHESAVQARRILRLEKIGTLSTVFPSESPSHATGHDHVDSLERRPPGLGGAPIGLMDYYADCEPDSGNPTILAIDIATSFKNVAAGSNITLSLRWHPQDGKWHSAASLPRFSLIGHLEDIDDTEAGKAGLAACFVATHPDAVAWLPGNRIHASRWTRFIVDDVYWIGGFGDRAYIGWISAADWQTVTDDEIEGIRLPGEKSGWGWAEWL